MGTTQPFLLVDFVSAFTADMLLSCRFVKKINCLMVTVKRELVRNVKYLKN